jgi:hypothetical protein
MSDRRIAQIAIKKTIGYNTVTTQAFMELERGERINLVTTGKVMFFDDEGRKIPLQEALILLKTARDEDGAHSVPAPPNTAPQGE